MKMITFVGIERCDFAYHVVRTLALEAPHVVAIDNSYSHELFGAVLCADTVDEKQEMIVRSNITFLRDIGYSPDFFNSFDYIVVYDGENRREEDLVNASFVFAMPDYRKKSLLSMKGLPENTEYILRDAAGKLNERSAAEIMEVDAGQVIGSLPHDAGDYANYLSLLYNGRQKLKGLSEEYIEGLAYVCGRVMDMDEKQAIQMIKKARKSA